MVIVSGVCLRTGLWSVVIVSGVCLRTGLWSVVIVNGVCVYVLVYGLWL